MFSGNRPLANHGEEGVEVETFKAISEVISLADETGEHPAKISLAWVRSRPGITALLVGARSPRELDLNIPAFEYSLPASDAGRLSSITDVIKHKLGPSADMWNADNRMR